MKEYLSMLADYNAHANREMYAVVAKLSDEQRMREVGSFYKSIFGLLSHIYSSDVGWLLRIGEKVAPYKALATPVLTGQPHQWGSPPFKDFASLEAKRPALDAVFTNLISEVPEADLTKVITYANFRGEQRTVAFWQALAHLFNHQTHHRGAVSEVLDELKVTNDYSGIVEFLNAGR